MNRVFLAALLLSLLAPARGVAQPGPEQRIEAVRRRATELAVPVALLDGKIAEGRAKGVPMDRIAVVLERRLEVLVRARAAMSAQPVSAADLSVGADALESGVTPEVLSTLAAQAPAPQRAMAIAVLGQLVRSGEASDRALARVTAALRQGPDALRELPGQAGAARSRAPVPPGRANAEPGERGNSGAARGQGNGPPSSIPAPGEGRGRGKERGNPNGKP